MTVSVPTLKSSVYNYRKTGKKFEGLPVYKRFFDGEFAGYCQKVRTKQLRFSKNVNGKTVIREVNVGWHYASITRPIVEIDGVKQWMPWSEIEKLFE